MNEMSKSRISFNLPQGWQQIHIERMSTLAGTMTATQGDDAVDDAARKFGEFLMRLTECLNESGVFFAALRMSSETVCDGLTLALREVAVESQSGMIGKPDHVALGRGVMESHISGPEPSCVQCVVRVPDGRPAVLTMVTSDEDRYRLLSDEAEGLIDSLSSDADAEIW